MTVQKMAAKLRPAVRAASQHISAGGPDLSRGGSGTSADIDPLVIDGTNLLQRGAATYLDFVRDAFEQVGGRNRDDPYSDVFHRDPDWDSRSDPSRRLIGDNF